MEFVAVRSSDDITFNNLKVRLYFKGNFTQDVLCYMIIQLRDSITQFSALRNITLMAE